VRLDASLETREFDRDGIDVSILNFVPRTGQFSY
jgi:hypothetical protein